MGRNETKRRSRAAIPVGLVGLGTMGALLARRALARRVPLMVYNRTAAKAAALAARGARVAATPAELARAAPIIFTALTGPQALSDVLRGDAGIAAGAAAGTIVCDLSTQDPTQLRLLANELGPRGIVLVEAPMTGSVHAAGQGTLTFMTGGDAAALARVEPWLRHWGRRCIYFGELGHGNTAKLAMNLLVGVMAKGLAEAVNLLTQNGTDVPRFFEALSSSGLASPLYQRLGARYLTEDRVVRFSLANLKKDVRFCVQHPAWHGRAPAMLTALAATLQRLHTSALVLDYSALLTMENNPLRGPRLRSRARVDRQTVETRS